MAKLKNLLAVRIPEEVSANMKKTILDSIDELLKLSVENLKEQRYQKFRKMGAFLEG